MQRVTQTETAAEQPDGLDGAAILSALRARLEEAHRDLRISPDEFDEVAAELGRTLDFAKVPEPEKGEVLAAFAAHKGEVNEGFLAAANAGS